jgi:hypothetical protein
MGISQEAYKEALETHRNTLETQHENAQMLKRDKLSNRMYALCSALRYLAADQNFERRLLRELLSTPGI